MKRRELLIGLSLSPLALAALGRTGWAEKENGDADEITYLFVQSADGATLRDGVLTLKGVHGSTLYFSDRPERVTGHIRTDYLVSQWGEGEDSFASDPPNAALSILNGDKDVDEIVVILNNPRLDSGNLSYDVEVLEGAQSASGGICSLFIDTFGNPLSPGSVAGVHRRHRRRRRRRLTH